VLDRSHLTLAISHADVAADRALGQTQRDADILRKSSRHRVPFQPSLPNRHSNLVPQLAQRRDVLQRLIPRLEGQAGNGSNLGGHRGRES
jgi:hypothetical protein